MLEAETFYSFTCLDNKNTSLKKHTFQLCEKFLLFPIRKLMIAFSNAQEAKDRFGWLPKSHWFEGFVF